MKKPSNFDSNVNVTLRSLTIVCVGRSGGCVCVGRSGGAVWGEEWRVGVFPHKTRYQCQCMHIDTACEYALYSIKIHSVKRIRIFKLGTLLPTKSPDACGSTVAFHFDTHNTVTSTASTVHGSKPFQEYLNKDTIFALLYSTCFDMLCKTAFRRTIIMFISLKMLASTVKIVIQL